MQVGDLNFLFIVDLDTLEMNTRSDDEKINYSYILILSFVFGIVAKPIEHERLLIGSTKVPAPQKDELIKTRCIQFLVTF